MPDMLSPFQVNPHSQHHGEALLLPPSNTGQHWSTTEVTSLGSYNWEAAKQGLNVYRLTQSPQALPLCSTPQGRFLSLSYPQNILQGLLSKTLSQKSQPSLPFSNLWWAYESLYWRPLGCVGVGGGGTEDQRNVETLDLEAHDPDDPTLAEGAVPHHHQQSLQNRQCGVFHQFQRIFSCCTNSSGTRYNSASSDYPRCQFPASKSRPSFAQTEGPLKY